LLNVDDGGHGPDVVVVVVGRVVVVGCVVVVVVVGRVVDVVVVVVGWVEVVVVVTRVVVVVVLLVDVGPQVTPLRAKVVGIGLAVVQVPRNPKPMLPPLGMEAFQPTLLTLTCDPDWVTVPFHAWVTVCPAAKDQVSRHPFTGSPRLSTLTLVPKPPGHWLVTE